MDRQSPPSIAVRSGGGRPLRAAVPTLLLLLLFANTNQAYRTLQALDIEREDNFVATTAPAATKGVGYTEPPKLGSKCDDLDEEEISGGSCNSQGCECVFASDACRETETSGNGFPYAVICPDTCELVTPSTDTEDDKCLNPQNEVSTIEVKCANGRFVPTANCYNPKVAGPIPTSLPAAAPISSAPVKTPDEGEDNFFAPAAPAGAPGVGYTEPPKSGSKCADVAEDLYDISGGPCDSQGCACVLENMPDACRETETSGNGFPYAVICPALCELVTPSSDTKNDQCINAQGKSGTIKVKCIGGFFSRTEKCYSNLTNVPTSATTNVPTSTPTNVLTSTPTNVPTSPSVSEICPASQTKYQNAVLNFLQDNSISVEPGTLPDSTNPCQYSGIECVNDLTITRILLAGKTLKGEIPEEIGCLTELTHLDLSSNQLDGTIPSRLKWPALRKLNLAHNSLTGTIPESVFSSASLEELTLDRNKLSGPLKSAVGKLGSLRVLSLFSNNLYGYVPEKLGSLLLLKELHLDQNNFQGRCGVDLCDIVNFGNLAYLSVDCKRVSCPCATHCSKEESIQLDNNWGPPIDISGNPGNSDQFDPNQNQGYNGASNYNWGGNTKREACLCDPLTGRPCIRPRQQGCRTGYHWCNFACNGTFPCRCDAWNQPCERDIKRICGSVTYACHNCSRGGLRGRCVCDYQTGLPCIMMKYPVCGQNNYECNMCG